MRQALAAALLIAMLGFVVYSKECIAHHYNGHQVDRLHAYRGVDCDKLYKGIERFEKKSKKKWKKSFSFQARKDSELLAEMKAIYGAICVPI